MGNSNVLVGMAIEFFSIQVHFSVHITSNFEWTVQIGGDTVQTI